MNKWLNNFLQKRIDASDNNLSVLSVPPRELLCENLEDLPPISTDNTDKTIDEGFLSVLSVLSREFLCENLEDLPQISTDNTDKFPKEKFSADESLLLQEKFERTALLHEFEERIAIAEYDGQQNKRQAQRIAYQDAFIAALTTIPYEIASQGNWFSQHIKKSQTWLVSQGIYQPV